MRLSRYLVGTALGALALVATAGPRVAAADEAYVSKAEQETLHQAPLPGVEGKEVIIARFTAPPKFVGGRHYHPGPVYVYVLEGELTVESDGQTKTFKAGELYPEPVNEPMLPKNLSATDELKVLVFQIGDIGKPMMVKAE